MLFYSITQYFNKKSVIRKVKKWCLFIPLCTCIIAFVLMSCHRNQKIESTDRLNYSTDTIFFDTVFTSIGSVTKTLKFYNPHSANMPIDAIQLRGGDHSPFRIAVDGDNGSSFQKIEVPAGDSVYVFVEVTIDPNNEAFPFIAEDYIDFSYNGVTESIYLAAWGQNAYFHGGPDAITTLPCNQVWNNDKPHVIYGLLEVAPNCNLTINAGTQVYLHKGAGILVNEGTLTVQGQKDAEVVFQGDRLDGDYTLLPGQWGVELDFQIGTNQGPDIFTISRGGIWIYKSPGSLIDYAIIKNGNTGIQVDTTGTSNYALTLTNTKIDNMAGIGLWGQGAHIYGSNNLITNCGEGCAYFSIGGKYVMDNCTFANYWTGSTRTSPTLTLNNYYKDINEVIQIRPIYQTQIRNCIIYGNSANLTDFSELVVDLKEEESQDYLFSYCLVDYNESLADATRWDNIINQPPFFCDVYEHDFHLSTNSSRMIGGPFNSGVLDLDLQETGFWKGCYDYTGNCN